MILLLLCIFALISPYVSKILDLIHFQLVCKGAQNPSIFDTVDAICIKTNYCEMPKNTETIQDIQCSVLGGCVVTNLTYATDRNYYCEVSKHFMQQLDDNPLFYILYNPIHFLISLIYP